MVCFNAFWEKGAKTAKTSSSAVISYAMTVSCSISFCFNIKHNLYVLEKYCYLVIARIYTFRTQAHAYPECFARHDENSCKLFAL